MTVYIHDYLNYLDGREGEMLWNLLTQKVTQNAEYA